MVFKRSGLFHRRAHNFGSHLLVPLPTAVIAPAPKEEGQRAPTAAAPGQRLLRPLRQRRRRDEKAPEPGHEGERGEADEEPAVVVVADSFVCVGKHRGSEAR